MGDVKAYAALADSKNKQALRKGRRPFQCEFRDQRGEAWALSVLTDRQNHVDQCHQRFTGPRRGRFFSRARRFPVSGRTSLLLWGSCAPSSRHALWGCHDHGNMVRSAFLSLRRAAGGQFFNVGSHRRNEKAVWSRAHQLLEQFGLAGFKDVRAAELPHGASVCWGSMAVASSPKLLLLDEP